MEDKLLDALLSCENQKFSRNNFWRKHKLHKNSQLISPSSMVAWAPVKGGQLPCSWRQDRLIGCWTTGHSASNTSAASEQWLNHYCRVNIIHNRSQVLTTFFTVALHWLNDCLLGRSVTNQVNSQAIAAHCIIMSVTPPCLYYLWYSNVHTMKIYDVSGTCPPVLNSSSKS